MKHKVIVADDSQTIQKVISITLNGEPFEITECLEIKNLSSTVSAVNPKIVLLDFNLSEDKTGYDLCRDIKSQSQNTLVIFLFGTFDSIDEDLISECGASNWIVKPFDGNKFINLCRSLIDHDPNQSFNDVLEHDSVSSKVDSQLSEDWVMDVPSQIDKERILEPEEISSSSKLNALENSMQDWGIEIPSVIGQPSENLSDIPDIISSDGMSGEAKFETHIEEIDQKHYEINEEDSEEEGHFPESSDLEYPDMIEVEQKPTLELTSLEDLNLDVETPISVDNLYNQSDVETDVETLKKQIQDEQEDLWSLDSEEESPIENLDTDSNNVHMLHDTPADFPKDVMSEDEPAVAEKLSEEAVADVVQELSKEVVEEELEELNPVVATKESVAPAEPIDMDILIEKLRPMIEEIVKTECQKMAEKVSWEIIPDLAENLIKNELQKISDQVLDQ